MKEKPNKKLVRITTVEKRLSMFPGTGLRLYVSRDMGCIYRWSEEEKLYFKDYYFNTEAQARGYLAYYSNTVLREDERISQKDKELAAIYAPIGKNFKKNSEIAWKILKSIPQTWEQENKGSALALAELVKQLTSIMLEPELCFLWYYVQELIEDYLGWEEDSTDYILDDILAFLPRGGK